MTTSWHVGEVQVTALGARAQAGSHRPVADSAVGRALSADQVPEALLSYTSRAVNTWVDSEAAEPWGDLWRGEDQAAEIMRVIERAAVNVDFDACERFSTGLGALEREFAEKTTRLDGEFTLEWTHPTGLIEDGWRYTAVAGEATQPLETDAVGFSAYMSVKGWYRAISAFNRVLSTTGSRPLPATFAEPEWGWDAPSTDYTLRMMTFDAVTHHGLGTSDSGFSVASLLAHMRLSLALQRAEISYEAATRMVERCCGLEPAATQFKRMQPGRKPVPKLAWDAALRRPAVFELVKNLLPRFRSVWGPPKWWNDCHRRAAGRMTTLQRSAPQAQVRAEIVQSIIASWAKPRSPTAIRLAAKAGLTNIDDYDVLALDYAAMDLHIEYAALRALGMIERGFDPSISEGMAESVAILPVLTPTVIPGTAGYLWKRRGRMLSGWLLTSAGDTAVNGGALLTAISRILHCTLDDAADLVINGVIDFILAGDDTLLRWPKCMRAENLVEQLRQMGLPVGIVKTSSFLARQYRDDASAYTNYLFRQIQNQWFSESRSRQTDKDIVLAGVVQRRHLLRNHPQRGVFDAVMHEIRPDVAAEAGRYTAADIPILLERARVRGIDERDARGMISLGHALDPDMSYGSLMGSGDPAADVINAAVGRRMLNTATAYAAAAECGFSLKDVEAVFTARSSRQPLPEPQKAKLRGVTLR